MDRVMQHNVLAMSGKAVEASGDVNTLLLDKTGTITLGNRQAVEFIPVDGVTDSELADAAQLSSLADETPEGRSIVVLAKEKYSLRGREVAEHEAHFIPFSAYTRMSGVDMDGRQLAKGRHRCHHRSLSKRHGGKVPASLTEISGSDLPKRRHASGRGRWLESSRRGSSERHRQRRHEGPARFAARDGHSFGHDHRRQSSDGRGHCVGSRRR